MIEKTKWYSWKNGKLPKGCRLCVKGKKSVLFITGLCSKKNKCYYCPIAEDRMDKDVIRINEREIKSIEELYEEIKICNSEGMGITGGDPLMRIDRATDYIKKAKEKFGKDFHIHLYCPMELVDEEILRKLSEAGLDEIRFHLDVDDKKDWNKLLLAKKFRWKAGVEIPVIPGKDYSELINFIRGKIDFLNLNELELSDSEVCKLGEMGFTGKDDFSYAVKDSEELALKLMEQCNEINVHYCTVKLKDEIQIPNRLKNRVKKAKEKFDKTKGYHLFRGVIYTKELTPSFGHKEKLKNIQNREEIIKNLEGIKENLVKKLHIKRDLIKADNVGLRIITSTKIVKKFKNKIKNLGLVPAITEELPTYDQFEIETEFI